MPTASMAPPATKGERTRARILEAAAEHFAAVGFENGSVPQIARAVGVSHATLYQHFGRKDELFRAAVEADLASFFLDAHAALDAPVVEVDDLVLLVPHLFDSARRHPLARRVLADIDRDQHLALRDSPELTSFEHHLAEAIGRGQENGALRRDISAGDLARGLIAVVLPMLVVALRLDGAADFGRADDALRFLSDMLRPTEQIQRTTRKTKR